MQLVRCCFRNQHLGLCPGHLGFRQSAAFQARCLNALQLDGFSFNASVAGQHEYLQFHRKDGNGEIHQ